MLFRRRRPQNYPAGLAPLPAPTRLSEQHPPWLPFAPGASAHDQIGRYGTPLPTQLYGQWPGVQLKCGVESMRPSWMVYTGNGSDVPYFQQTTFPSRPATLLTDGRRPGRLLTPATAAALRGPVRAAQAQQAAATSAGILGF